MSSAVDQGDDAEVQAMDVAETRGLARIYRDANSGIGALSYEEATGDQLAGLRHKVKHDMVPYADFGLFRPHGDRLTRALRFTAKVWAPEQAAYVARELPGPPSYYEWRRSWRCYRYALIVLQIATPAVLDRYYETVDRMVRLYGVLGVESLW